MTITDSKSSKQQQLQDKFTSELPRRLKLIRDTWNEHKPAIDHGGFHRLIHNLVGASGTFGYMKLYEDTRKLEVIIMKLGNKPADAATTEHIEELLNKLEEIANAGPDRKF